ATAAQPNSSTKLPPKRPAEALKDESNTDSETGSETSASKAKRSRPVDSRSSSTAKSSSANSSFHRHLSAVLTDSETSTLRDGQCLSASLELPGFVGEQAYFYKLPRCLDELKTRLASDSDSLSADFVSFLRPAAEAAAGLGDRWSSLLSLLTGYRDLTLCDRRPGPESADRIRLCYCLHLLNHLYQTRRLVLRNNSSSSAADPESLRDQGFARPRVLLLLPVRESALKAVETLISLLPAGALVSHRARFLREFRCSSASSDSDRRRGKKPPDFEELFGANSDDDFRLGIAVAKRTLKLYTPFLASDLIVASPLGLADIVAEQPRLLSSLELLIIDQADSIAAQNWCRVLDIVEAANRIPEDTGEADLFRCRLWYLEGRASLYRQTVCLSGVRFPELSGLFGGHMRNWRGKLALRPHYAGLYGEAGLLGGPLASVGAGPLAVRFVQFASSGPAEASTARLAAFRRRLLPWLREGQRLIRVLVYAPSYLDWADLRAELRKESLDFCAISEYTPANKAASYQGLFREGQVRILLYSERYHFYHRQRLRGIHNLLFYGPPTHPAFFEELCRLALADAAPAAPACAILVDSATDWHSVAPLCGPRRAGELARAGPV
ncbi:hypothetical protein BOX15_Mlig007032g3, partial [Macrostomum lignano]